MSERYTARRSSGLSWIVLGTVGIAAWMTEGEHWEVGRDEKGAVKIAIGSEQIAAMHTTTGSVPAEEPVQPEILAQQVGPVHELPTNFSHGQLQQSLRSMGAAEAWCAGLGLLIDSTDVNTGAGTSEPAEAETTQVNICLEERTLTVAEAYGVPYIQAFMRTDPRIEQVEGRASLFVTMQQNSGVVAKCKEAKEEMRDALRDDMEQLVGRIAAAPYEIEIHVDPRSQNHPCDDPLLNP